jgi:hypothetical protein
MLLDATPFVVVSQGNDELDVFALDQPIFAIKSIPRGALRHEVLWIFYFPQSFGAGLVGKIGS